ncbi:MAG TPA: ABC transporter permease subunit [Candidatus Competibacteraceae bacterium]|nr:ABC transporter permease subunit [Candidatus Competibacteraceae bacterium]
MFDGYIGHILDGAVITLEVAFLSLLVATGLGLLGAALRLSHNRWLSRLSAWYCITIRGIPDLVLMLLFFYGGQILANQALEKLGLGERFAFDQFISGVATLGFIYGAYLSETFRGAILAVPRGQAEAGQAYGMNKYQVFFGIVLPQMIRLALPGYTNNWLVMTKASALVSVIGLQDMMYRAKEAGSATREPFTYLLLAGAVYLAITSVSLLLVKWAEKRYSVGVRLGEVS